MLPLQFICTSQYRPQYVFDRTLSAGTLSASPFPVSVKNISAITGGPVRTYRTHDAPASVQSCHSKAIFYLPAYTPFSAIRDSLSYFCRYTLFFNVFTFALLKLSQSFSLVNFLLSLQKSRPALFRSLRRSLRPLQLPLRSSDISLLPLSS